MNLPINYISKQNLVHTIYAEVAGVPFPAGIVVEDANEDENENVQIKGDDEPNTEK